MNNTDQAQATAATAEPRTSPSHDHIARRAYEIYNNTGQLPGQCQQNWEQAATELTQQKASAGYPEVQEAPSPGRTGTEPTLKTLNDVKPSKQPVSRPAERGNRQKKSE